MVLHDLKYCFHWDYEENLWAVSFHKNSVEKYYLHYD